MTGAEREPHVGKEGKPPIDLKGKIARFAVGQALMWGGVGAMAGMNLPIEQFLPGNDDDTSTPTDQFSPLLRLEIVNAVDQAVLDARGKQKAIEIPPNLRIKIELAQKAREESNRAEEMRNKLAQEANLPLPVRQAGTWLGLAVGIAGLVYTMGAPFRLFFKDLKAEIREGIGQMKKEVKAMISRPPKRNP